MKTEITTQVTKIPGVDTQGDLRSDTQGVGKKWTDVGVVVTISAANNASVHVG